MQHLIYEFSPICRRIRRHFHHSVHLSILMKVKVPELGFQYLFTDFFCKYPYPYLLDKKVEMSYQVCFNDYGYPSEYLT